MKKKLLIGLACFAVIAAAVTVTVSTINANTPLLSALMLENLQALSDEEGRVPVSACWHIGYTGDFVWYTECHQDTNTDPNVSPSMAIYPCPEFSMFGSKGTQSVCTP